MVICCCESWSIDVNQMRGALAAIAFVVAVPLVAGSPNVVKAADPATIDGQYAGTGPIGQGVESTMTVLGRGNVPTSGVGAVALNVTVTNPTLGSFLTVWPTGAPRPLASNLNFVPGQTVANAVITKVGTNGKISVFNNGGGVDVIIDVVGWFPDNQSYVGLTPARFADTRKFPDDRWPVLQHRRTRAGWHVQRQGARPRQCPRFGGRCRRLERHRDQPRVPHRSSLYFPPVSAGRLHPTSTSLPARRCRTW